jgi:hypothetical protein
MSNLADRLVFLIGDVPGVRKTVEEILEEAKREGMRELAKAIWEEHKELPDLSDRNRNWPDFPDARPAKYK